jgi:hypothetical protein
MTGHYLKQLAVAVGGFVVGAGLGRLIAPESAILPIAVGLAAALYAQALVFEWFGGDWFFDRPNRRRRRPPHRPLLHH